MPPELSAATLMVATVDTVGARAPAVMAAAAQALAGVTLALHFGDGSQASLRAQHSRLIAEPQPPAQADVAVHFDNRSLKLLFDADRRPVDAIFAGSLDVRGSREQVLATWRCFELLAQRASGLRAVQALWVDYRDRDSARWTAPVHDTVRAPRQGLAFHGASHWPALDWLDQRYPPDVELGRAEHPPYFSRARSLWDGRASQAWAAHEPVFDSDLQETMQKLKARVTDEILHLLPKRRTPRAELYDPMRDYVGREGKGLRPTLTIASCMALGGAAEHAVRAAAALELFHNGFLVHDDIADGSTHRRGRPTLHQKHGVGIAVNAGDAMNLFAVDLVLSNLPTRGLSGTLGLIHEVLHMCRETVEGQAVELGWIRRNFVPARDADYFRMSTQKTGWYTCISPCRMGAVCAGVTDPKWLDRFNETFRLIGIAFQIQDDVLNLVGETERYGKEPLGDLLEGKRTVMMIHLFRTASERVRKRMSRINAMPREAKTQAHAEEMLAAMHKLGSIDYAIGVADRLAHRGVKHFERDLDFIGNNEAKAVLRQIAHYVTTRSL
ncbi:MAG: polyprenyl synthetase family protein [Burkholderiaceae bacterium]|nr:polyprenyl synthetase family protein [Burkholderiaceae bacterium]